MTLLFADGFEQQDHSTVWSSVTSTWTSQTANTRLGYGRWVQSAGQSRTLQQSFSAVTDVYVHCAVRMGSALTDANVDFYGDTNVTRHIRVTFNASGAMEIRDGAATTVRASSATGLFAVSTWYQLVIHARVHDSTGIVEVWLDGDTSAPFLSYSGDTKNAGTNSTIDSVRFATPGTGTPLFGLDDVYITDEGNKGDVRCQTLVPTGAGSTTGLTPSTGSNWQTVDESPPVATDYSGSASVGARDTYQMTDLVAGTSSVYGVKDVVYWHKSDAGAANMKRAMKVGSSVYYGSSVALSTSMASHQNMQHQSPDTSSAWTVSEVNAMEHGAEVS